MAKNGAALHASIALFWLGTALAAVTVSIFVFANTRFVSKLEHGSVPVSWVAGGLSILAFAVAEYGRSGLAHPEAVTSERAKHTTTVAQQSRESLREVPSTCSGNDVMDQLTEFRAATARFERNRRLLFEEIKDRIDMLSATPIGEKAQFFRVACEIFMLGRALGLRDEECQEMIEQVFAGAREMHLPTRQRYTA